VSITVISRKANGIQPHEMAKTERVIPFAAVPEAEVEETPPQTGARIGWFPSLVGRLGAWFIYALIWIFGRTHRRADIPWLLGPLGGKVIGDAPYRDVAAAEGLTVERNARDGGLVPSFEQLRGDGFDPTKAHPLVREFYEHTAAFAM